MRIYEYEQIDSTNEEARRQATKGIGTPALFVAQSQSAGRGRMGRSFFSPNGTGLYASLLIEAPADTERMVSLTAITAVAATDTIKARLGIDLGIKWVNDLYLGSKKVAGILAESFVCEEKRFVVIGIGINLCTEQFPEELREKAGSLDTALKLTNRQRCELAEEIAKRLLIALEDESRQSIMQKYRSRSCVIGKKITYISGGQEVCATATDITESGALAVTLEDGSCAELGSGEISIFLS